jgi:acyl-homoserine-lactone acylase
VAEQNCSQAGESPESDSRRSAQRIARVEPRRVGGFGCDNTVRELAPRHGWQESTPDVLLAKLIEVIDDLIAQHGRWQIPYGNITRLQRTPALDTPHGKFDESASSLPVPGVSEYDGAAFTFNALPFKMEQAKQRLGEHGDSYVSVIEFGTKLQAKSVVTFGASGDAASPHYFDQAQLYANGEFKPAWFTRQEVEENASSVYHPGEEKQRTFVPPRQ